MYSILKKELKSYFDHPTAYILLVVFLVVNSFFFFRVAFIQGAADLRPMFDFLPWLLLFFVPAITMRLLAEENRAGTLDLVLVQPVKPWQVLLGKLLGSVAFLGVALLLTLLIPILLSSAGSFDWGQIVAQYVSALFFITGLAGIGLFASVLSKNQVVAFITALAISFFFIISGFDFVLVGLSSGFLRTVFSQLSLTAHFQTMARGVIDLRDLIFFITFAFSFLSVTYLLLIRQRSNRKYKEFRQLKMGVALLVVISVLVNLVGASIPGRLDLTRGGLYTLSPAAKELLKNIDDIVTIKVFTSETLPAQIDLVKRDVQDMLRDFERASSGNVKVEFANVKEDDGTAQEARSLGIQPVQFNILSQQEFSLKQGYFGLAVLYADQQETIPFIQDTSGLEYQLASFIRKLTVDEKQKVAFLTGHGEKSTFRELSTFRQELAKQYEVEEVTLTEPVGEVEEGESTAPVINPIDSDVVTLVVAGPTQEITAGAQNEIRNFINRGGTVLLLIDQISVNPQFLQVTPNTASFASFAEEYGVRVNQDLAFDMRSNESVTFGGGILSYILPYPFWARVPAVEGNPITGDVQAIVLPWASTLEIVDNNQAIEVFKTSPFAARQSGTFNIAPDQQFNVTQADVTERLMAAAVILGDSSTEQSSGRLLVVGDSDFLTEQFVRNQDSSNLVFGLNSIDWLVQDQTLVGIRSKNRQPAPLVFKNEGQPSTIRFINLIGVPILVIAYGAFRLFRRKKKAKQAYVSLTS